VEDITAHPRRRKKKRGPAPGHAGGLALGFKEKTRTNELTEGPPQALKTKRRELMQSATVTICEKCGKPHAGPRCLDCLPVAEELRVLSDICEFDNQGREAAMAKERRE